MQQLSKGKVKAEHPVHLDPDIDPRMLARLPHWRGSLGQTGIAQGHLQNMDVGAGDVFLFFGWFRQARVENGVASYVRGAPNIHQVFGYLQIQETVNLGEDPDVGSVLAQYPWLKGHPHLEGSRDANNTVYLASDMLHIDGVPLGCAGSSPFSRYDPFLTLTVQGRSRSTWNVPDFVGESPNDVACMSFHGQPDRWRVSDTGTREVDVVAKGQEFVAPHVDGQRLLKWMCTALDKGCEFGVASAVRAVAYMLDDPARYADAWKRHVGDVSMQWDCLEVCSFLNRCSDLSGLEIASVVEHGQRLQALGGASVVLHHLENVSFQAVDACPSNDLLRN